MEDQARVQVQLLTLDTGHMLPYSLEWVIPMLKRADSSHRNYYKSLQDLEMVIPG